MKATRQEPEKFSPVVLTLESQAEVDRIYGCLRNDKLFPFDVFGQCQDVLEPFLRGNRDAAYDEVDNLLK